VWSCVLFAIARPVDVISSQFARRSSRISPLAGISFLFLPLDHGFGALSEKNRPRDSHCECDARWSGCWIFSETAVASLSRIAADSVSGLERNDQSKRAPTLDAEDREI